LGDDIERRHFEISLHFVAVEIGASGQFFNAVDAIGNQAACSPLLKNNLVCRSKDCQFLQ